MPEIRAYIDQLRSFLPYVPPLPTAAIEVLHTKGDFGGIVRLIRGTMNVGVNLTVHWTDGPPPPHLPSAIAWIRTPDEMPYYGTPKFKQMRLDVFILKAFRDKSSAAEFAIMVAHELSHVVLDSIHHPLRREEKAVDLTAMLLGFSYVYRTGAHTQTAQVGYLSSQEMDEACRILVPASMRARSALLKGTAQNSGRLWLLGYAAVFGATILIYNEWDKHQAAVSDAATIQRDVPQFIDSSTALVGARAGFMSVTLEFLVAREPSNDRWNIVEQKVRRAACTDEGANIARGISYIYEYRTAAGSRVARFEISSCP